MDIAPFLGFFSGLGLFFVGLNFLTTNLKKLTTNQIRKKIAKLTKNRFLALLWGGGFVTITQSCSASAFILVGMSHAGLIKVFQAFPILIGVNVFGGLILFILFFNIKLIVLFLLGLAGIIYTSSKNPQINTLAASFFGIGLLFFGLNYMQEAVIPLTGSEMFITVSESIKDGFFIAFLAGVVLCMLCQSSLPPIIILLPLMRADLVPLNEAIMFTYGTALGSSILTLLLSTGLSGKSKQITMFQIWYNIVAIIILVPLFYIEYYFDVPLVKYFAGHFTSEVGKQVSIVYFILNLVPGLALFFILSPVAKWLNQFWPESLREKHAKSVYIEEHVLRDTNTGLILIELEQIRLFELVSKMFVEFRKDKFQASVEEIHDSFLSLHKIISDSLKELAHHLSLSNAEYEKINDLLSINHLAENLNATVEMLGKEIHQLKNEHLGAKFSTTVIEGLDSILLSLLDVAKNRLPEDYELLELMTQNNGQAVLMVRRNYVAQEDKLSAQSKMRMLSIANHTEQIILNFGEVAKKYMHLSSN